MLSDYLTASWVSQSYLQWCVGSSWLFYLSLCLSSSSSDPGGSHPPNRWLKHLPTERVKQQQVVTGRSGALIYSPQSFGSFSASEITLIVTGTGFSITPAPNLSLPLRASLRMRPFIPACLENVHLLLWLPTQVFQGQVLNINRLTLWRSV